MGPLKDTLIDPFEGTLGFVSSNVVPESPAGAQLREAIAGHPKSRLGAGPRSKVAGPPQGPIP